VRLARIALPALLLPLALAAPAAAETQAAGRPGTAAAPALPLAAPAAAGPPEVPDGAAPQARHFVEYPENGARRILGLAGLPGAAPAAGAGGAVSWTLSGPDAGLLAVEAGALRFARDPATGALFLPGFEAPADADGDNRYEATLTGASADGTAIAHGVTVTVTDVDEPGRAALSASGLRPAVGIPVTAALADPDRIAEPVTWTWERSAGPGAWTAIPDANGPRHAPTAADAGHHLRVTALYADRFGAGKRVRAVTPERVRGPALAALSAETARSRADSTAAMHPAFSPDVTHYTIGCDGADTMNLSFAAPGGVRLAVGGVQPRPPGPDGTTGAAVTVSGAAMGAERDAVTVTVSDAAGAATRYTVRCAPAPFVRLRAEGRIGSLLAVAAGPWIALLDENAVPRRIARIADAAGNAARNAGFFLLTFGEGRERRWAHALPSKETEWEWRVLDRDWRPLRTVTTAPPLVRTGRHDFTLFEDGSTLLMAYEPALRDFSGLAVPDRDGNPWGTAQETRDSAIQIAGPDGAARWTWSSWGRIPLGDCRQHRFPDDWAHVSSVRPAPGGRVLASFRGCSSIMLLDPGAPAGEEIVWRIGGTNLAPADWAARGLGPAPLTVVGDPEGTFCGQHAAQMPVHDRLLVFDNGVACVTDPATRGPVGRRGEEFSRVVEYAIDEEAGEAVFVRARSLHGRRDMLGRVGGHVAVMPDGRWLVSWGWPPGQGAAVPPHGHDEAVTLVDPESGAETFSLSDLVAEGIPRGHLRAVPVRAEALAPAPVPLAAELPDGTPAGHGGAGTMLEIAVAFSRPVAAFAPGTPSIEATGARIADAAPLDGFGRPANLWRIALAPDGDGPVTFALRPGLACDAGGICTADGRRLADVPAPVAVDRGG